MASELTHTFATFHHCYICGADITLNATSVPNSGWKAVAQKLVHAPGSPADGNHPLVPADFVSHSFEGEESRLVHSACWKVITRVWGKTAFTPAELDGFIDCARDVAPFLPEIPFAHAPDQLDVAIDHRLDTRDLDYRPHDPVRDDLRRWMRLQAGLASEHLIPPALVAVETHNLPQSLEDFVTSTTSNPAEAQNSPDETVRGWADVIRMLVNAPGELFSAGSSYRPERVAQALSNLKHGGLTRFPHTVNFDVVRANAVTILRTLIPIPVESMHEAAPKGGKRAKLERPRHIHLSSIRPYSPFRLSFYTLRRRYFEENMNKTGFKLGMRFLKAINFDGNTEEAELVPQIGNLCGVRFIRDHVGTLAVHAKDGDHWMSIWQQDPNVQLSPEMGVKVFTAMWPEGHRDGNLVVVSDVSGLQCKTWLTYRRRKTCLCLIRSSLMTR